MRSWILVAALAAMAAPAVALVPPATPARHKAMRELPHDWLDDADLDGSNDAVDQGGAQQGSEGDDRLAGGERGNARADTTHDCKPTSGTTGAIIGAVAGGLLGNVIDGGNHRALGTLVGAGGGALLGREVEKRRACQ